MFKKYIPLLLCCYFGESCFSSGCLFSDFPDAPENNIPFNKSVCIKNNTNTDYQNNKICCVSIRQEVKTGNYVLLLYSAIKYPHWDNFNYSLLNIQRKSSVTKKWINDDFPPFYEWYEDQSRYDQRISVPSQKEYQHTGNIFYLLWLNGGQRKVFFGHTQWNNQFAVDEYDQYTRDDGVCYHIQKYLDIFVRDTHITLEKNSATSNHKIVNPLFTISTGATVNLAALPIKKAVITYDESKKKYELVKIEDLK